MKDIRNVNNIETHYDPESKRILVLGKSIKESQCNKILRAYENRNSDANKKNRKGVNTFANHN